MKLSGSAAAPSNSRPEGAALLSRRTAARLPAGVRVRGRTPKGLLVGLYGACLYFNVRCPRDLLSLASLQDFDAAQQTLSRINRKATILRHGQVIF